MRMRYDVRLTCAAIDIVESSCTPRSHMLVDAMMLHPPQQTHNVPLTLAQGYILVTEF